MAETATTIREIRVESPEASTLRFDLGGAPFPYRAGQYILIDPHQFEELGPAIREREAQRGKPMGPGYFSLSSDALDPNFVEITLKLPKAAPPPLLPEFLVRRAAPGRAVRIQGPAGNYGLPDAPPPGIAGFLHLCAGSGVAPNRGMIRHALARGWPQRHLLLLQDRGESDVLFRNEWRELSARHPYLLRVRHLYSQPSQDLISAERIRRESEGFIDLSSAWGFICGPNAPRGDGPGFVDRLKALLKTELGFAPDRVRTE